MNNVFDPVKEIENITNWIKEYFVANGPEAKAVIGISGGKDSTVAAALLVRALGPNRVIGVLMPENVQYDIDDSRAVCETLGISSYEINIGPACDALYRCMDESIDYDHKVKNNSAVSSNTPARMRMTTLYAVAALVHGRVVNTCNWSEDYVGYSTKYGDAAGDFSILSNYAVREVIAMGAVLSQEMKIPAKYITKPPADGLSGKSDEDNLGFTYKTLDAMLLDGVLPDYETFRNIMARYRRNRHKTNCIHLPSPRPLVFRTHRHWERAFEEEECFTF